MALQLRRGNTSRISKLLSASFMILALFVQPLVGINIPSAFAVAGTVETDSSNFGSWDLSESRTKGHNVLVSNGLHVWTDSNDYESKAAGYYATPGLNLSDVDSTSIDFATSTDGLPSVQLGVDRDGNGSWDGNIVYEPWAYGNGQYWTNKAGFGVLAGGGYDSMGTLAQYQAANPNAKVLNIGYSLGSGVKGDAVISKITIGETVYTFAASAEIVNVDPYYVVSQYKGIGVDIKVNNLTDATGVAVTVDRSNGGPVTKTAKQSVLNTLNAGTLTGVTAPIVMQQGTYNEAASSSWNQPTATWDATTAPTSVTVTITRSSGAPLVVTKALGETAGPFATQSEVMANAAPTLTVSTPVEGGAVRTKANGNKLTITGTFKDDVKANYATLQLVHQGSSVAIGTLYGYGSVFNPAATYANADGSYTFNLSVPANIANGEYDLLYTGTDFTGNVTQQMKRTFIIDNTAPTGTDNLSSPVHGTVVVTQHIDDNVAAKSGKLRIWKLTNGVADNTKFFAIGDVAVDASGDIQYTLNTQSNLFGDGEYVAKFTGTDTAGNAAITSQKNFVVDNTAPSTPAITSPTNGQEFDGSTTKITATWNAATDANGGISQYEISYDYTMNGAPVHVTRTTPATSRTQSLQSGASVYGPFTIMVRAQDNAGNWGDWSAPVTYYFGTTAPGNNNGGTTGGNTGGSNTGTGTADKTDAAPETSDDNGKTPAPRQLFTSPLVFNNDGQSVLGTQSANGDQNKSTSDGSDQGVKGTSDTKNENSTFSPLGFAWYWWLLILAAIAAIWWFVAARRRNQSEA